MENDLLPDYRYALRVQFRRGSYQCHWQKDMHKMFAFAKQMLKHRDDVVRYEVLRDDGVVLHHSAQCAMSAI